MAAGFTLADLLGGMPAGGYGRVPAGYAYSPDLEEEHLPPYYPPLRRAAPRRAAPYTYPAFGHPLDPYGDPYAYPAPGVHPWSAAAEAARARPHLQAQKLPAEFGYGYEAVPRPARGRRAKVDPLYEPEDTEERDPQDASAEALAAALGALRARQLQQQHQAHLQQQLLEQQRRLRQQQALQQEQQRRAKQQQQQQQAAKAPLRFVMVPAADQPHAAADAAPHFVLYPAADDGSEYYADAPADAHTKAPAVVYVPVAVPHQQQAKPRTAAAAAAAPASSSPLLPSKLTTSAATAPQQQQQQQQQQPAIMGSKPTTRVVKVPITVAPTGSVSVERIKQQQQQQQSPPGSAAHSRPSTPTSSAAERRAPASATAAAAAATSKPKVKRPARSLSSDEAATAIQSFWRGWRLARHAHTLRALARASRQLAAARATFEGYRQEAREHAGVITTRQQLEVSELAMRVLLNMDGLPAMPQELRSIRKALSADALRLQDQALAATQPQQQPELTHKEEETEVEHKEAQPAVPAAARQVEVAAAAAASDALSSDADATGAATPAAAQDGAKEAQVQQRKHEQEVLKDGGVSVPAAASVPVPVQVVDAAAPSVQATADYAPLAPPPLPAASTAAPLDSSLTEVDEAGAAAALAAVEGPAPTLSSSPAAGNEVAALPAISSHESVSAVTTADASGSNGSSINTAAASVASSDEGWTVLDSTATSIEQQLPDGILLARTSLKRDARQQQRAVRMKAKHHRRQHSASRRLATVPTSPRRGSVKAAKQQASDSPRTAPAVPNSSDGDVLRALGVTEHDGLVTMPAAVLKSLLRSLLVDGGAGSQ